MESALLGATRETPGLGAARGAGMRTGRSTRTMSVAPLGTKRLSPNVPRTSTMTAQDRAPTRWTKLPISLRAVISGLFITLAAVNVWPLLLLNLGVPLAALAEVIFLGLFLWWTGGGGPPRTTQAARATAFRRGSLSPTQWFWGVIAALFFAATIHASIVLLFRFMSFPMAAFRHGYDISFIPSQPLRWLAVVVSAISAGICEETGFRGYMQRPFERRHGAPVAILISSFFFMALHLTKAWATPGMVPVVFGAGILLGLLAWSSRSLIPGMVGRRDGHWVVCVLVDRDRRQLYRATNFGDGRRSALPLDLRCFGYFPLHCS